MDSSCWVTVDHFTKDTYNQMLKFPNSLPRPILSWEAVQQWARESTLSSDPATHNLENCRESGNRKATLYYSHIYTKHSEYAFLQPPNTFSGNNLKISLCLQTFHTLCFPFFPHTLFFTHSILYFLHTLFCILYLFQINVPGTIALKLEVLQLKRYQDNEEIHPKHIIFLNN